MTLASWLMLLLVALFFRDVFFVGPLAGDIPDDQAQASVIGGEEIVIISACAVAGEAEGGHLDGVDFRDFLGQETLLDGPGDIERWILQDIIPAPSFTGALAVEAKNSPVEISYWTFTVPTAL